ncbi:MAG: DNA replication/repair protein RecF [Hyphomonas sp.]|jgi:DNA replication and repair protein RecF
MTALTRLSLTDFRNYESVTLKLDGRAVCLYGSNGAGKTNLLEAVSQFGPGRGLRTAQLAEMTRHGATGGWAIAATLDDEQKIGISLDTAGAAKRTVRIDGAPASPGDLAERVRLIWLTPAMDGVFRGGASERRRFFDRLVMAHQPSHGPASARYEKALAERNALIERGPVDPAWADAIEARLAEAGAELAINRALVLADLQGAIEARPEGQFPKADLTLIGEAETAALRGEDFRSVFDLLVEAYRSGRRRDIGAGRTLSGPHRTDLGVIHRPTGAPAGEASTGQQKALLIGLVLASAEALAASAAGPSPLLLLDEAAAHLDPDRRAALFDELAAMRGQAWLTGTDAYLFESFRNRCQLVRVESCRAVVEG